MARTQHLALLAAAAIGFGAAPALAGGSDTYAYPVAEPEVTTLTTETLAAPPLMETYTEVTPVAVAPTVPKDGYYDPARYGGNAEFGYKQSHGCGGVLDGEHCLVILNDHMRRLRLDQPAGTILVGNPLIADVTVLGKDLIFISARSIGSTNLIILDKDGNEIVTYEIFVQEPRTKRVKLRNFDVVEHYQCTPYCERTVMQSDSPAAHGSAAGVVSADLGLDQMGIGMQSGVNPNTDPDALAPEVSPTAPPTALPGAAVPGGGGAAAAAGAGSSGGNLLASSGGITGPGLELMNSLLGGGAAGLLGGGNVAPAAPVAAPVRTDAPPLAN